MTDDEHRSKCPSCGKPGLPHGWMTSGVITMRGYLCSDIACPRARIPWYVLHLEQRPGKNACPFCGKPYLTIFQTGCATGIYLHRVQRSASPHNGLLEVTEACSVELRAASVGTGG